APGIEVPRPIADKQGRTQMRPEKTPRLLHHKIDPTFAIFGSGARFRGFVCLEYSTCTIGSSFSSAA
ncbi:hypothetical protein, partial [Pseudomonas citronellolis]|uniref:hypothetical protein n=1 Tax=Pseudomonas citronellolis TaxID=53408 RepID=UPI0023E3D082